IKLLSKGGLKAKINIEVTAASAGAIQAVEKTGGSVKVLAPKTAPKAEEKPAAKAPPAVDAPQAR
ncbi:MAG TPA: uL15 family ribosomal protein, partial [Sphingomonadales bacterium]|nr:uL15 family ribosomal protein [Sphingomonadales bacterium]